MDEQTKRASDGKSLTPTRVDKLEEVHREQAVRNKPPRIKFAMREKLLKLMARLFRVPYHPPPDAYYSRAIRARVLNADDITRTPAVGNLKPASNADTLTDVRPLLKLMTTAYSADTVSALLALDEPSVHKLQTGEGEIPLALRGRILDVYDVLARVHFIFSPGLAARWLTGYEPLLGGARPVDVLLQRGASPVIEVLGAIVGALHSI